MLTSRLDVESDAGSTRARHTRKLERDAGLAYGCVGVGLR